MSESKTRVGDRARVGAGRLSERGAPAMTTSRMNATEGGALLLRAARECNVRLSAAKAEQMAALLRSHARDWARTTVWLCALFTVGGAAVGVVIGRLPW